MSVLTTILTEGISPAGIDKLYAPSIGVIIDSIGSPGEVAGLSCFTSIEVPEGLVTLITAFSTLLGI
ncbi:hypothetical protein D3C75_1125660 [compost metagenome]